MKTALLAVVIGVVTAALGVGAAALGSAGAPEGGRAHTMSEYAAGLAQVESALRAGRLDDARASARALRDVVVAAPQGTFRADAALLTSVIESKRADVHLIERLDATLAELRRARSEAGADRTNAKLLDAIGREEDVAKPREGGDALPDDALTGGVMTRIADATSRALKWIGDKLTDFFEWLMSFRPKQKPRERNPGGIRGIVVAVAVVIVLLIGALAYIALRRSRAGAAAPIESAVPAISARDEDPLSRGVNEWERYAAQLATAGRTREAIRAWYHAVLVTLYSTSILHFRKGRTNWEYVATLAPSLVWRGEFIALTRRFETEWYGLHESSEEALEECREIAQRVIDSVRRAARGAA